MTKEDKQLLLKDLCARLSYGVKGIITYDKSNATFTVEGIDNNILHLSDAEECYIEDFKPYLCPMSSMTEEEKKEYCDLQDRFLYSSQYPVTDAYALFDFLNAHHFDFRNLLERGLAIEVTENNNPYEVRG